MRDLYLSTKNPAVVQLVEQARKTNASRDKTERKAGFATPASAGMPELLRTAITAIGSGLEQLNKTASAWEDQQALDCIAEGLCMVQDAELKLRNSK